MKETDHPWVQVRFSDEPITAVSSPDIAKIKRWQVQFFWKEIRKICILIPCTLWIT